MKKLIVLSLMLIMVSVFVSPVFAEIPAKVGILYELTDNERLEVAGTAVVKDIAGIKGLDIDALIAGEIETMLTNDDKIALTGLSYNYDVNEKLSVGAGVAVGLKRIEKLAEGRTGEFKGGIYAFGSYRF